VGGRVLTWQCWGLARGPQDLGPAKEEGQSKVERVCKALEEALASEGGAQYLRPRLTALCRQGQLEAALRLIKNTKEAELEGAPAQNADLSPSGGLYPRVPPLRTLLVFSTLVFLLAQPSLWSAPSCFSSQALLYGRHPRVSPKDPPHGRYPHVPPRRTLLMVGTLMFLLVGPSSWSVPSCSSS
jgi:IKI3 family